MGTPSLKDPPPRRVAIFRALQLGDLLCAVPVFRALRHAFPEAEIVLIGLPWASVLVHRFGKYLSGFREFPGYPGLPERTPVLSQIPLFLDGIQSQQFDLVLQLHGNGRITNPLVATFGASLTAGFFESGHYCPDLDHFFPYPEHGLEVDRLLGLLESLGVHSRGSHLEFPLYPADFLELRFATEPHCLQPGRYICMHVGASTPVRRWPPDNFVDVARHLSRMGLDIVLTGTEPESELTRRVAEKLDFAWDLAGRTNLGALAALVHGARLVICNDTGISHLADALRVPSVVLSTGTNPQRWAPRDRRLHRVLCSDSGVSVSAVIAQAEDVLSQKDLPVCHEIGAEHSDYPPEVTTLQLNSHPKAVRV